MFGLLESEGLIFALGGVELVFRLLDLEDCMAWVFLEAGPLITPGFKPV